MCVTIKVSGASRLIRKHFESLSAYFADMKIILIGLIVLSTLTGCSRHYHALDAQKKAKLVTEVISNSPQCRIYKKTLAMPTMDDDAIDNAYHAAQKAGCVNKDI